MEELWDFYVLYKAIRKIDPDHAIVMNAVWNPQDMPDPSLYGWTNVVYEKHFYEWANTDHPAYQSASLSTKIKIVNEDTNYNVPKYFGEFTMFSNLQSWEYAPNPFDEQGCSAGTSQPLPKFSARVNISFPIILNISFWSFITRIDGLYSC